MGGHCAKRILLTAVTAENRLSALTTERYFCMARPRKQGCAYFPFDVSFFRDIKIRSVTARFGTSGVLLYVYLLTVIYDNGYYIEYSEDLVDIAAADLMMSTDKVGQIINYFCKRSLFDDTLFTTVKVLTSAAIQRRYQEIVKSRALKTPVAVEGKFWVLNFDETQDFIQVRHDENYSEKNESFSENNPSFSEKNDIKKSKVKKSKVKERECAQRTSQTGACAPSPAPEKASGEPIKREYGTYKNVFLTDDEYSKLKADYPNNYERMIDNLSGYMRSTGKTYKDHCATMRRWAAEDERKAPAQSGFSGQASGRNDDFCKSSFDINDLKGLSMFND